MMIKKISGYQTIILWLCPLCTNSSIINSVLMEVMLPSNCLTAEKNNAKKDNILNLFTFSIQPNR